MFKDLIASFSDIAFLRDLFASIAYIAALVTVRSLIARAILRREDTAPEARRRMLVYTRNLGLVLFVLGMVVIWGHEIEAFAVSLVAIAAAIVLATKEMLMCILGSVYRTTGRVFDIGDRIEIAQLRGRVIDITLLSTTLIESSAAAPHKGTVGRVIVFPNSLLLSNPVFNETMLGAYVLQTVHVAISRDQDWQRAETALLQAANNVIAEYASDLAVHVRELERTYALEPTPTEPRVRVALDDREAVMLQLQLPVPLGQRARIEQVVLHEYLKSVAEPALAPDLATAG
ncbi:mechanosensitive ion channel family protein [Silvimonas sp. JCM 19000]